MEFASASRPAGTTGVTFAQTGRLAPMFGLSVKIFLLSLVTLTIYRFWGRTEVRRYLWNHATINNKPLDYVGKGSELFIGFLIALIVYILPLVIALNAISLLGTPGEAGVMDPTATVALFAIQMLFVYLIAVGLYQALRYRLSRTEWRGIRFALTGSAFGFGLKYLWLMFLNILLIGWLTPVVDIALFRTIARQASFGDRKFTFEGSAGSLYGPFALTWVLIAVIYIGVAMILGLLFSQAGGMGDGETGPAPEIILTLMPQIIAVIVVAGLLAALATAFYGARSLRVKGSGLRLDGLRFELDTDMGSYLWLTVSNALLIIFTLGIALPVTELRRFRYIFSRLAADGHIALDTIGQSTGPRPRFGEGLAEAFGMGNV